MMAESWEVDKKDHNVWIFHLRHGMKRHHDGRELTAEDFVHSFKRTNSDPQSKQKQNVRPVKDMIAVDKYTLKVVTKQPTAPLLGYLFDFFFATSKDLYDKYGAAKADRDYPWGWGPYMLKDLEIGQRIVLQKNPDSPDAKPSNPDVMIFRVMREAEQRVTALLNREIQIAQFVPPHLAARIRGSANAKVESTNSVEIMFLAMSPKHKPWDNVKLRQAVCHAIDRKAIVKTVLDGQAELLDGPVGRYINDKEVTQAMIPMLHAVGIKAKLRTPEWATLWADVQKGKTPFYYMGRGSVVDPSVALQQYFETGGSPRIGISDPAIDKALQKERSIFEPAERKKAMNAAFKEIVDKSAACFMWRHKLLYGIANGVNYKPEPADHIYGIDITMNK
jgi:peptide/nickel transport system substrate-binding protein